jgi:hopanoid biosynthesis associated protein HpnK
MVGSPAAQDAVKMARRIPSLRVGLHVVLVEAAPVLPATFIRRLVNDEGYLRNDMVRLGTEIALSRGAKRQIRAEIEAQFAAFRATGLTLDHVNAHKHFHLQPSISAILIPIAARYGARFLRVPMEDRRIVANIDGARAAASGVLIAPLAHLLRARAYRFGLKTADRLFGLGWSGHVTKERLIALAASLPEGITEIYTHPAIGAGFLGAARGYQYQEELAGLTAAEVVAAFARKDIQRSGFSDLT